MLKRLSHRVTALIGVIGMAVSLFLSGFATKSVGGMVFLQGFVFGLSGAVVFLVSQDSQGANGGLQFRADCVHFAHSMVHEETWIDCWDYVVRWRCWGSRVGYRKSGISVAERNASHESVTGHRKDDRKLGSPMDVSIRRLSDPSTGCRKSRWSVVYCFFPDWLILQPAAWTLRPGYTRPAPSTTSEATRDPETTAQAEAPEKSIFRSTKYTRILAAWLIASYPFLIPPYVRKLVLRFDRSVYTEISLCVHSSFRNMVRFHPPKLA